MTKTNLNPITMSHNELNESHSSQESNTSTSSDHRTSRRDLMRTAGAGAVALSGLTGANVVSADNSELVGIRLVYGGDVSWEDDVIESALENAIDYIRSQPEFNQRIYFKDSHSVPFNADNYGSEEDDDYNRDIGDHLIANNGGTRRASVSDGERCLVVHTRDGLDKQNPWDQWGYGGGLVYRQNSQKQMWLEGINGGDAIDEREREVFTWHELIHMFGVHHGYGILNVIGNWYKRYKSVTAEGAGYVRNSAYVKELNAGGSISAFHGSGFLPSRFRDGDGGYVQNGKFDIDFDAKLKKEYNPASIEMMNRCIKYGYGKKDGIPGRLKDLAHGEFAP